MTSPWTLSIPSTNSNSAAVSSNQFKATLPSDQPAIPQPYKQGLVPLLSQLQPHCLARDQMKQWFPLELRIANMQNGDSLAILDEELQRVLTVMNMSWALSTRECYGAGLLVFHVFCDERNIPEEQCYPVDTRTMLNFVSSCAGSYSRKTSANYVYVIKAWHILHGQEPSDTSGAAWTPTLKERGDTMTYLVNILEAWYTG
ncbi:hypothetical protein BDR03DRAFT_860214 [Suillus americanus]|nr:hypothetical protein BDR03DRAFT_860214 [Suillus americanus]